jgi:prolyl oligopeptidase
MARHEVAWVDRDTLIVGTDFGPGSVGLGGYGRILKLWKRGESLDHTQVIHEGQETDVNNYPYTIVRPEGNYHFIHKLRGTQSLDMFFVSPEGAVTPLPMPTGCVGWRGLIGLLDGRAIFYLTETWEVGDNRFDPDSLVAVMLEDLLAGMPERSAELVLAPDPALAMDLLIGGTDVSREHIVVAGLRDADGCLMRIGRDGDKWKAEEIEVPTASSVRVVGTCQMQDVFVYSTESYLKPRRVVAMRNGASTTLDEDAVSTSVDNLVCEKMFATSADGTRVPYFIVRPRGLATNGLAPTILSAYGGAGLTIPRSFIGNSAEHHSSLLRHGGVLAFGCIRGGGEYGARWHRSALQDKRHKQFEDVKAIAEDLFARGITSSQHLGFEGASYGGLLASIMLTRYPALFAAVSPVAPITDLINIKRLPFGNAVVGELGDPDDPKMREYLLGYSPFQVAASEPAYPPCLILTSRTDQQAPPGHARRFAAKLLDLGQPLVFFEAESGGHGGAAGDARFEQTALQALFFLKNLGA